jgi:RNA polymerase sigma factor (sigma-70 family)
MISDPQTMRFLREIERSHQIGARWFFVPTENTLFSRPVLVKTTLSPQNQKIACTAPKVPAREKMGRAWHLSSRPQRRGPNMPRMTPDELGRLYREHAPALRLYARQWTEGGEDLVQDAFVSLAQHATAPDLVLPWLYRVVRNGALAASRSAARRRRRQDRASVAEAWFDKADNHLDGQEATRLLAELPLEQREIIVARLWGGLTFDEVAVLMDCSLPTAHRRYQAALAALRERVQQPWTQTAPVTKAT